jgi:hypothetical protein
MLGLAFRSSTLQPPSCEWIRANEDPRAWYHIGVDYLLGRAGAWDIPTVQEGLGLVGPVIFFLHARSTITRSPHITRVSASGLAPVYEGSPTYDKMWNASVSDFVVSQSKVSTEDLLSLCCAHQGGAGDPGAYIRC